MYRDPSEFRERFKAYKDGKSVQEIYGLPGYVGGKSSSAVDDTADFLRLYEGFKEKTYLDGKGIPTIGYGFTNAKFVNKGRITRAEAEIELKRQIAVRLAELRRKLGPLVWDSLSNDSKKALTSYHFNYPAGFKDNTKFMLYWRAGRYSDAIKEVDAGWNDAANPGLRTRRIAEQKLLRSDPALFSRPMPEKPSDAIILRPDVLRVAATIPQEKTIPIADPRNATIAEALRAMWAHAAFENMPKVSDMPIWEYRSLPALTPVEYDAAPFKYNNGKLPGYQNGLTPLQIEDIIVQNQGTIQQGHRLSPLSTVANSMYKDYRKPFAQLFTEGGLGNFARGLQQSIDSWNKEVRGIADVADHVNVLLDILTLSGGSVAKLSAKQAIREAKLAAKKTIKPTKTSIKKTLNATEVAEDVASKPKVKIDPKKYEQQTEYTRKITNQKTLKYNKTKLPSETPVLNSTDFPENTNINALYGPERMLFSNKIVNNNWLMDIAVPHEFKHYLLLYYNYTPELAMIMERAFPFSEKFIKEHPDFNFVKEGGAMLSELEYEIGKRYGFPVGKDFEDVVKHISKQEYEDMASKLSLYNRDANAERIRTGIDKSALVDALIKVPATTAPILAIDRNRQYNNGKLPRYGGGHITTSGAGVTSVYQPAPNSPEAQPAVDLLERIANFLPYVGTIQDWDQVTSGNIGKIPSAVIGTVADIFLPGLRSSYKAAKAYEAMYKATPKIVDKIKYYKASLKAYRNTSANIGYLAVGLFEDILDDLRYQYPSFINKDEHQDGKLPEYSNGKIRIKPANRGKFNATKKRTGKTTEELTHSKNTLTRKRAIFAQNAKKWKH